MGGLLSGGDDYIVKPFSLRELEARITAHLKREERHQSRTEYRFKGDCLVDYAARTVQIGEQYLELTVWNMKLWNSFPCTRGRYLTGSGFMSGSAGWTERETAG